MVEENKKEEKFGKVDLEDILKKPIPEIEYVIEDIIRKNGITLITAQRKSSKTLFSQYLSLCVVNGINFLGKKTKKSVVLYLDLECGKEILLNRFKALCIGNGLSPRGIKPEYNHFVKLEGKKAIRWKEIIGNCLKFYKEQKKHVLVIVDTCVRTLDTGKENSSDDIRRIFEIIKPLLKDSSWLLIHHSGKDARAGGRGSSEWEAFPDDIFKLSKIPPKNSHKFKLSSSMHRSGNWIEGLNYQFCGDMKKDGLITVKFIGEKRTKEFSDLIEETAEEIKNYLFTYEIKEFKREFINGKFPKNIKDENGKTKYPLDRITKALNSLIELGILTREGEKSSAKYKVV